MQNHYISMERLLRSMISPDFCRTCPLLFTSYLVLPTYL
jgi:hypothetical protein